MVTDKHTHRMTTIHLAHALRINKEREDRIQQDAQAKAAKCKSETKKERTGGSQLN